MQARISQVSGSQRTSRGTNEEIAQNIRSIIESKSSFHNVIIPEQNLDLLIRIASGDFFIHLEAYLLQSNLYFNDLMTILGIWDCLLAIPSVHELCLRLLTPVGVHNVLTHIETFITQQDVQLQTPLVFGYLSLLNNFGLYCMYQKSLESANALKYTSHVMFLFQHLLKVDFSTFCRQALQIFNLCVRSCDIMTYFTFININEEKEPFLSSSQFMVYLSFVLCLHKVSLHIWHYPDSNLMQIPYSSRSSKLFCLHGFGHLLAQPNPDLLLTQPVQLRTPSNFFPFVFTTLFLFFESSTLFKDLSQENMIIVGDLALYTLRNLLKWASMEYWTNPNYDTSKIRLYFCRHLHQYQKILYYLQYSSFRKECSSWKKIFQEDLEFHNVLLTINSEFSSRDSFMSYLFTQNAGLYLSRSFLQNCHYSKCKKPSDTPEQKQSGHQLERIQQIQKHDKRFHYIASLPEFMLKKCSGCKLVRYCSTECQHADWNEHRILCKATQEVLVKKREGQETAK